MIKPSTTVVQGPGDAWTVLVRHESGREQRFECDSEKQAQGFARLFEAKERPRPVRPERAAARATVRAHEPIPEIRVCRTDYFQPLARWRLA